VSSPTGNLGAAIGSDSEMKPINLTMSEREAIIKQNGFRTQ
jgi:hypothetical protein